MEREEIKKVTHQPFNKDHKSLRLFLSEQKEKRTPFNKSGDMHESIQEEHVQ